MNGRIVAALVLAAAALGRDAYAFCRSTTMTPAGGVDAEGCPVGGAPLYWPQACIGYAIHQSASKEVDLATATRAAARAFTNWESAACSGVDLPSVRFFDLGPTT